eukprot:5604116-Pleurochrysis_carterae.AAC.1
MPMLIASTMRAELSPSLAIPQMRDTIRELDDELQRDYRNNAVLEQSLAEKQTKVEALQARRARERHRGVGA